MAEKTTITNNMGGSDFQENAPSKIASILNDLATWFENLDAEESASQNILDSNGNKCGIAEYSGISQE